MSQPQHTYSLRREVGFGVELALSIIGEPHEIQIEDQAGAYTLAVRTSTDPLASLRALSQWTPFSITPGVLTPVPAGVRKLAVNVVSVNSDAPPATVFHMPGFFRGTEGARYYGVDQLDSPGPVAPPFPPFTSEAKDFNIIDIRNTIGPWGQSDGRLGTISYWIKQNITDNNNGYIFQMIDNSGGPIVIQCHKNGFEAAILELKAQEFGAADMQINSDNGLLNQGVWSHVMASWNYAFPADPANNATLFVDGVQQFNGVGAAVITQNGPDADLVYATHGERIITGHVGGVIYLDACISNFYLNIDERVDLTDPANRLLFYGPSGESVGHGADGSFPTGNQPFFYAPDGDTRVNVGYGPQLVQTGGGTITDCADAPVGFVP